MTEFFAIVGYTIAGAVLAIAVGRMLVLAGDDHIASGMFITFTVWPIVLLLLLGMVIGNVLSRWIGDER